MISYHQRLLGSGETQKINPSVKLMSLFENIGSNICLYPERFIMNLWPVRSTDPDRILHQRPAIDMDVVFVTENGLTMRRRTRFDINFKPDSGISQIVVGYDRHRSGKRTSVTMTYEQLDERPPFNLD